MVHDLYATQVLVDRADPVHYGARFHRTPAGEVDLAVARLQWSDGLVASFAASYLTPPGMAPRGFDRMSLSALTLKKENFVSRHRARSKIC